MTNLTARQRILEYLSHHNGASAVEISRALRVTAANIRYHLGILSADGRIQNLGSRPEQGRGRPVQIYGLSAASIGNNMASLTAALLTIIQESYPLGDAEKILHRLAERIVPNLGGSEDIHITRRLARVISNLNQSGYAARWEAHAAAPQIFFERCPYAEVVNEHPELCRVDQIILARQLDNPVKQTARLEKNTRGTLYCQFILERE